MKASPLACLHVPCKCPCIDHVRRHKMKISGDNSRKIGRCGKQSWKQTDPMLSKPEYVCADKVWRVEVADLESLLVDGTWNGIMQFGPPKIHLQRRVLQALLYAGIPTSTAYCHIFEVTSSSTTRIASYAASAHSGTRILTA